MFLKVCSLIVLCDYMPIFAYKLAFNQNDIFPVITTRIRHFFSDEQDVQGSACKARACFRLLRSGRILWWCGYGPCLFFVSLH